VNDVSITRQDLVKLAAINERRLKSAADNRVSIAAGETFTPN